MVVEIKSVAKTAAGGVWMARWLCCSFNWVLMALPQPGNLVVWLGDLGGHRLMVDMRAPSMELLHGKAVLIDSRRPGRSHLKHSHAAGSDDDKASDVTEQLMAWRRLRHGGYATAAADLHHRRVGER